MTDYAVLLRGVNVRVNVGGRNILPMSALREQLSCCFGVTNVQTYRQSGNVLCRSSLSQPDLADRVSHVLAGLFDIRTPVFVIAASALRSVRDACPFGDMGDGCEKAVHFFFLSSPAGEFYNPYMDRLEELKSATERFETSEACFYLYAPDGIGRSKLAAAAENCVGITTTARKWRTVNKLLELLPASDQNE